MGLVSFDPQNSSGNTWAAMKYKHPRQAEYLNILNQPVKHTWTLILRRKPQRIFIDPVRITWRIILFFVQFDHLICFLVRQNWTTGILRDELELLDALSKFNVWWMWLDRSMYLNSCSFVLVEGRLPKKIYVTNTETQREFNNPKLRSIHHLKHIEENRKGRYAYTPNRVAPRGAGKLFERYETLSMR